MEINHQQPSWWKLRFSFKNATILVCFLNIITALFLLQAFLSAIKLSRDQPDAAIQCAAELRYIMEAEEMRRAMEPLELIKRIREIQQEAYTETEMVPRKVSKQTAALDLSKRLKDIRTLNDANSQKALEEWRKRKMERARQRQLEKNETLTSQTIS
ncbi:hypothetical protein Syun_006854 [Stephania yunnanensis]|uniref:Uncharacterized protein n=1 Tax=Stephania yunnanensis TaxID=152371 RepID=A0AAP0KXE5_9MAGN